MFNTSVAGFGYTLIIDASMAENPNEKEISKVSDAVHPLESVTIAMYVPGMRESAVGPVCTGKVFQEYESGGCPPLADAVMLPSAQLPQVAGIPTIVTVIDGGSTTNAVSVILQPKLSVSVTEYDPAISPVMESMVSLVDHR